MADGPEGKAPRSRRKLAMALLVLAAGVIPWAG